MANRLALRSPQFVFIEIPVSLVASCDCQITIDGSLRYTLVKNTLKNTTQNFEVAELIRDYLTITYTSTYVPQEVEIDIVLRTYADPNGTGTVRATKTYTTQYGYEGYGYYEEGTNPLLPVAAYLISKNYSSNKVELYLPQSTQTKVPQIVGGVISVVTVSINATSIGGNYASDINRIDCTKYGNGRKIIFINRYGVQQDLWFFLKETKTLARKNENYKTNTLTYPNTNNAASYSVSNAPNKTFNTTAKQKFTLSSGYYSEAANAFFEELLLSEYVWLERPQKTQLFLDEQVPVKVVKSSIAFKTSVNDRLIEYTIEFEEAFDYINNIR